MKFLQNTVGKKLIMAATGFMMTLFVLIHLLGNSSIFIGPEGINAYAMSLQSLGPLVWVFRFILLVLLCLHVFYGIRLTLENRTAKPGSYAVTKRLSTTFAAENMVWSGLLLMGFIVYHLLHFTFHVINPEISAAVQFDMKGRPDVFSMVVSNFRRFFVVIVYVSGMIVLALHLMHGIESSFQTAGLNSGRTLPVMRRAGTAAAIVLALGYISIAAAIFTGIFGG